MGYPLYLVFVASYFLHLTSRVPVLGVIRFDLILVAVIAFFSVFEWLAIGGGRERFKTTKMLVWLIGLMVLSLPFVQWPGSVIRFGFENYAKVVVFFFFTLALVNTEKRLKGIILVFVLCQVFRALEPAYLHVTTGYWGDRAYSEVGGTLSVLNRLSGSPHDVVNANQLAWVIVSTIPFLFYLGWQRGLVLKLFSLAVAPVLLYVLFLTGSRSGVLSLAVLVITMVLLGRSKIRGIAIGGILVFSLSVIIVGQLSSELKERYLSTFDRSLVGGDTAQGRITGVEQGISTISRRPIFGHGLGSSREVSANFLGGRAQLAHNLYVEVLQELGIVGFVLFMLYIKKIVGALQQAKRTLADSADDQTWVMGLITAAQAWIAMHLFYSLSCFGLSSWEWYWFGGIATVCLRLARQSASEPAYGNLSVAEPPSYPDRLFLTRALPGHE